MAQVQSPPKVETQSAPLPAIEETLTDLIESEVKSSESVVEFQEKVSLFPPISENLDLVSTIPEVFDHQKTPSTIPSVLENHKENLPSSILEPREELMDSSTEMTKEDVAPAKNIDFVTDYMSAEDIFRLEKEKQKQMEEKAQQSYFAWPLDYPSERSVIVTAIVAVAVIIFLGMYYQTQNKSQEKFLLAKISLLDSQISENLSAKEECGLIQDKLTEYETLSNDLQALNDQIMKEKTELLAKVSNLINENEALQKEKESVTESGLEASKMLQEILASQADSDQLQNAVEVLQEQLNRQQSVMETLSASLSIKSAENETLTTEANELRVESDRYKIRVKTLQTDIETLKTSNRNYQQKIAVEDGELMKLKQERETWISERRSLTNQVSSGSKKMIELEEKVERLKSSLKAKEGDLAKTLELMKQAGKDSRSILELTSLVQLEKDLAESNITIEKLTQDLKDAAQQREMMEEERSSLHTQLKELQSSSEAALRDKLEAETRLEVSRFMFFFSFYSCISTFKFGTSITKKKRI